MDSSVSARSPDGGMIKARLVKLESQIKELRHDVGQTTALIERLREYCDDTEAKLTEAEREYTALKRAL